MPKLTGQCLCGDIRFEADGELALQANCHCSDCKQVTGAAFATLLFMKESDVKITGKTKEFKHSVDSGNSLSKHFCPKCGSQMFGSNTARPGSIALRAGSTNEQELVKPQFNVYASGKLDCTILDESIPAFDKMPS